MEKSFTGRCPSGRLLTAYVEGSLSVDEQLRVEDHLLDCPLCESAVAAFTEHGLPPVQSTRPPVTKLTALTEQRRAYWPTLAAAAAVLLLIFAGWQYQKATAHDRIFNAFFDPQPIYGFEQQRVVNQKESPLEAKLHEQAYAFHLKGNYPGALMAWRAYFDAGIETDSWLPFLYAATAALATGKDEEAAYFLSQMPTELTSTQGEQLAWYRILLHIKQNQLDEARSKLEVMVKHPQSDYGKVRAEKLLARLAK